MQIRSTVQKLLVHLVTRGRERMNSALKLNPRFLWKSFPLPPLNPRIDDRRYLGKTKPLLSRSWCKPQTFACVDVEPRVVRVIASSSWSPLRLSVSMAQLKCALSALAHTWSLFSCSSPSISAQPIGARTVLPSASHESCCMHPSYSCQNI